MVLENLDPKLVWGIFEQIFLATPHESKHEEQIRAKIKEWVISTAQNFDPSITMSEDAVGNIVIKVPATPGYENSPTVVIQGHIDMVCEKNKGTIHDFDNDPLKVYRDGDWITAEGTTLGADNGIGVAAGMAAATDDTVTHGPLELLCTIDEETGMTGVNALQPGFITGNTLLNLDSEEDGAFYVSIIPKRDFASLFNVYKACLQSPDPMLRS